MSKTLFENEPCGRCGGSGHYSFNMVNGTTCFGCSGKGVKLTKRGKAAQDYLDAMCAIPVEDVVPGMRIKGASATYTVASVGEDRKSGSVVWHSGVKRDIIHREFVSVSGKPYWEQLGYPVRRVPTDEMRQKALAYQDTLTKAGKPRKNTEE